MERKLCLSRTNKILAGVCGGFAEYFQFDVTLVRIIWALLGILVLALPFVLYILCWAIMPLPKDE
jgi:phage shock protein PspC (stress-responsive transcriptional regulator)